jgi:ABC-type glycerol-3-phosphate transport system substrate-binding protein
MKMKKLLVLLLAAAMTLSMVACGAKKETTSNETTPVVESEVTETEDTVVEETVVEETEPVVEEPSYDFGGITVKLAWAWPAKYLEPSDETDRFNARVAEVEEKLNVKFEWVTIEGGEFWDKMVANTLAGDNYGSVMYTNPSYFAGWINAGIVADLGPIAESLNMDLSDPSWDSVTRTMSTYDGKQYGLDKFVKEVNGGLIFNKRLIEEAGLVSPYEHVKNGTWNWETFEQYAKALTVVGADGTTTQWGFSSMTPQCIADSLILSNDGELVDISTDIPTVITDSENTLEALSLYQKMITVDKTIRIGDPADWESNIKAYAESSVAMFLAEQWVIDYINTMEPEDFGYVYFPMGPKATDYVSTVGYFNFWIPSTIPFEEQQAALLTYSMLFDNLYPELTLEEFYQIKGEQYANDEEGAAIYSDIQTRDLFKPLLVNRYGIERFPLYDLLLTTDYTPQSAAAELKPVMEAVITDFFAN